MIPIKELIQLWRKGDLSTPRAKHTAQTLRDQGHTIATDDLHKLRQMFNKLGSDRIFDAVFTMNDIFNKMKDNPEYKTISEDTASKINARLGENLKISKTCIIKLRSLLNEKKIYI